MNADALWFLDTLVRIPVARANDGAGVSVVDSVAPRGDSPPLHIHRTEDEVFHVVDGEMTLRLGEQELRVHAGETLLAPKGVPHTYRVDSETARFLAITTGGDFEAFVREFSRPAEHLGLPEPSGPPSLEAQQALGATAATHGIDLVGPPLS